MHKTTRLAVVSGLAVLALTGCSRVPYYNGAPQEMCGTDTTIPIRVNMQKCDGSTGIPGTYRYFTADPKALLPEHDVPEGSEIPPVYLVAARPGK
jgi:hypothetical protein